jgi:hypothetical protein
MSSGKDLRQNGGSAAVIRALRTVGNPDHGGADSGDTVFLYIVGARRELPHMHVMPMSGRPRLAR